MANVLTDLAADLYKAADVVGRELVGAIPSVTQNADGSERVAVGDVVRSHFTRKATAVDTTPSMTIPEGTDQTVDNKTVSITKSRAVQIPWTGEDMKHVNNGAGWQTVYGDQIAQAVRTLANEAEVDLCAEIKQSASRAVGTAGTTPFASDFDIVAEARQELVDNGCPQDQLSMVLNTLAGTKLRNLAQLQKANEAGGDDMLRRGVLLDLQGLALRESAGIALHTKGTGTGYLAAGGEPVDETTLALDTGTGTILAGDVITFAADTTNKYVVNTAFAGGSLTIGDPGLLVAMPDNNAVTVGDSYTPNFALHRSAAEIVFRPPAVPEGGDAADDAMIIQDPVSGLLFEIRAYKGYRKSMFEVALAWGVKGWKPDHIVAVMG